MKDFDRNEFLDIEIFLDFLSYKHEEIHTFINNIDGMEFCRIVCPDNNGSPFLSMRIEVDCGDCGDDLRSILLRNSVKIDSGANILIVSLIPTCPSVVNLALHRETPKVMVRDENLSTCVAITVDKFSSHDEIFSKLLLAIKLAIDNFEHQREDSKDGNTLRLNNTNER